MHSSESHEKYPDPHHDLYSRTTFGFWVYLLTDLVLFGTLFATYAVLVHSTFGGPSAKDLFYMPAVLWQTLSLLMCSSLAGLGGASAHRRDKKKTLIFWGITFVLGCIFLGFQVDEFTRILNQGHAWDKSAFLSAYFTLVGTHTLHVIFGLLWIIVLLIPVLKRGIEPASIRRLSCLRMFWQFLNIVWVLIFSFVYLLGVT